MKLTLLLTALAALASPLSAITPNALEVELGNLIRTHAGQQRSAMIHDPVLNAVARAKALDLGRRKYWSHVDPDGFGPNRIVQLVGYELPWFYGDDKDSNFIESLGAGATSAAQVMAGWLNSPDHREHILGTDPHYAEQTHYGLGYADVAGSPHRRYFVFISAPPPENGLGSGAYADWLLQRYLPKSLEGTDDSTDHDGDGIPRIQEFVLGFEPRTSDVLPSPIYSASTGRLEWRLPLRLDVGTIKWRVEHSTDLKIWSLDGVEHGPDNVFSIPVDHEGGFLRLVTER